MDAKIKKKKTRAGDTPHNRANRVVVDKSINYANVKNGDDKTNGKSEYLTTKKGKTAPHNQKTNRI